MNISTVSSVYMPHRWHFVFNMKLTQQVEILCMMDGLGCGFINFFKGEKNRLSYYYFSQQVEHKS